MHFLSHFGNVKTQMKEIGSETSAPQCLFDRGRGGWGAGRAGGLQLFRQCPYGNKTFHKGASLDSL